MKKIAHSRRYNRHNFIMIGVVLMVVLILVFSSIARASSNGNPNTGRAKVYSSIYVHEGDTLWTIAEAYMSEEYSSVDQYVNEVKQINHIGSRSLHAGCYITVPRYIDPES